MVHQAEIVPDTHDFPCWCGQSEGQLQFRTSRFGLVRCPRCGCYRIDPPPLASEGESSAFYTDYYVQPRSASGGPAAVGARRSRFWQVVKQVPSLDQVAESSVDIGCGEGQLCAELRAAGWPQVAGVDVSRTRVARARELYPQIPFHDRPLEETATAPASVDLAIMDNVIEHLPDPRGFVQRIRRYLRAGGRLVIITPNMESGHFRLLGRRWTPELAPHAHIFLFTNAALRELVTEAGYEVEVSGSFHLPYYALATWLGRLKSGDVQGAAWRSLQEMGSFYGRVIGAGPMLYLVARPVSVSQDQARRTSGGSG